MLAADTWQRRKALEAARRLLGGSDRYVDLAVDVQAVDGDGRISVGGRFDTVARVWSGPPDTWATWTVGQGQMPPLIMDRGTRFVCVGAMGAGKTEVLARAAIMVAIMSPGKAIGLVAPTQKRMRIAWQKIERLLRPQWVSATRMADHEIVLVNGCALQFVAAKIHSRDVGSPIQGYSWVAAFVDEEQDIEDEAMADVMMRGRDAADGLYTVLSTCTLKDTPSWRARKARYESLGVLMYRMEATANPFVAPEYWAILRETLTERQYRMRVLALDAPPERATYPLFSRDLHLREVPTVGARDITHRICGAHMLVGHDPGTVYDVSIMLKAYEIHGEPAPIWFVVDELTTEQSTSEIHVDKLRDRLSTYWRMDLCASDGERAIVRADPYGNTETRPHVTVYREFALRGFDIRPAQYNDSNTGPGNIPKEARIGTVNRLLRTASGETRLYVAIRDGEVVAPRLVAALEMSERDESGKAETQKKGPADLSHWPAALGLGLWPYEKTRMAVISGDYNGRIDHKNPR